MSAFCSFQIQYSTFILAEARPKHSLTIENLTLRPNKCIIKLHSELNIGDLVMLHCLPDEIMVKEIKKTLWHIVRSPVFKPAVQNFCIHPLGGTVITETLLACLWCHIGSDVHWPVAHTGLFQRESWVILAGAPQLFGIDCVWHKLL